MALEIRTVTADRLPGEILMDTSAVTLSQDMREPGTLSFSYPPNGAHSSLLSTPTELVVLINGVEPINGRFTIVDQSAQLTAPQDMVSYVAMSNLFQFNSMIVAPAIGSSYDDAAAFSFTNKTMGWLIRNAIDNSLSRNSAHPWLNQTTWTFDGTTDSAGIPWSQTFDVIWVSGQTVHDVIDWGVQLGLCEAYMYKDQLYVFQPSGFGKDKSTKSIFNLGDSISEYSVQKTVRDVVNSLLVTGIDNVCTWVQDTTSISKYGYHESKLELSNVSQYTTMTTVGTAYLSLVSNPVMSYTLSVSQRLFDSDSPLLPLVDYQVGDKIGIFDTQWQSLRVRLITIEQQASNSYTVTLSLSDFVSEDSIEYAAHLARLGLGA